MPRRSPSPRRRRLTIEAVSPEYVGAVGLDRPPAGVGHDDLPLGQVERLCDLLGGEEHVRDVRSAGAGRATDLATDTTTMAEPPSVGGAGRRSGAGPPDQGCAVARRSRLCAIATAVTAHTASATQASAPPTRRTDSMPATVPSSCAATPYMPIGKTIVHSDTS